MKTIGVIPARWGSKRFEGKILKTINGKSMIQLVWEAASKSKLLDDLIIATDNQEILDETKRFKAKAVLTSVDQPSGTDRIGEVVNQIDAEIIVNIQGDEPMVNSTMIDNLVSLFKSPEEEIQMATVVKKITDKKEIFNPNIVKVVLDRKNYAIYFSRSPVPYNRKWSECGINTLGADYDSSQIPCNIHYYKHIGLYAYTKDFIYVYTNLPVSVLEKSEKLEQLRALENGYRIKTVETDIETVGVDTPEDLEKLKRLMEKDSYE